MVIGGKVMNNIQKYRFVCTLSFGDIYGQIVVWLIVIFLSLAAALALMGASRPIYALATVGLILVLSLPLSPHCSITLNFRRSILCSKKSLKPAQIRLNALLKPQVKNKATEWTDGIC
jgi:hypothetical protein